MKFIGKYKNSTPIRLMVITTLCVFVAESIIMIGLSVLPEMSTIMTILIDSTFIVLFVLPILYYSLFLPLQKSLQEKTESETKFRLLASHTNDWEYCIDSNGEYIYITSSCEEITGYSKDEFLKNSKILFDIIKPDYISSISNHYEISNNELAPPHTTEFPITHKNGEERWIEHNCMSVFDEHGTYIGRRGNNRDITKRKMTEDSLRESEERYRLVFETASYLITSVDADGNLVDCNNKIVEMLGYTRDEIIGQSMTKIIHQDYHEQAFKTVEKLVTSGQSTSKEYKMIRKDGSVIDVNISSSAVIDSTDDYVHSICIIDDITERKKNENLLQNYYDIINRSPAVAFVWKNEENWPIELVSENIEKLFGYTTKDFTLAKKTYSSMIHPDDVERVLQEVADNSVDKNINDFTHKPYRIITKSNQIRWIEDLTSIVRDEDRNITHYQGIMQDITSRMEIEESFKKSEEKFKLLIESSNDIITMHDLTGRYTYYSGPEKYSVVPDDIIGKMPSDLFDKPTAEKILSHLKEVVQTGESCQFEVMMTWEGTPTWFSEKMYPIYKDDKIIAVAIICTDISKKRLNEKAILESEQRFKAFTNQTSEGITVADLEGNYVFVNPAFCKMSGYTNEELLKMTVFDMKAKNQSHTSFSKSTNNMQGQALQVNLQRKDMTEYLTEIVGNKIVIGDDELVLGTIRDITERKQTEDKLRQKDEYVHTVLESTADGILAIDALGKIRHTNQRFIEMWNIPHEMLKSGEDESLLQHVVEQLRDPDAFIAKVEELYQSLEEDLDVLYFKDGRVFERYSCPIKCNGVLDGRVWSFRDISERKKAEDANALLSRAIEQADETIVITDAEGKIQYANPAFERASGYSTEEAIGENPRVLKSGKHDDAFYKNMWDVLSNGKQWQGEIINKKKDGSLYIENVMISPVFDSQGKIINYVAAKNDITETKRLQKLESRAERLEMAGTIAGQVAHDFNNLLAPIMAYPEFIRDELPHDSIAQAYLDTIETAAKKIADINQDLLTMGRRGHYNQDIININTIVLQSVKEMESRTKTVTCEMLLGEDIMNVKGGTSQIHRMLTNLLVNSQDAMDNIGVITIKTENYYADDTSMAFGRVPKGEYIKLTVADNGCGIPDDIIQKILDPFFSTKVANKKSGSGLGLSVVDSVMKDHNGYLDLSSQVGIGTSFYLYFPITREESENSESMRLQVGTEKILIVDDDDVQREVTGQILKRLNYKISSVSSGEKAVEFLKENQQELVILDMMMPPGIDGTETYRQILEINANQKAIIVSGFSESDRVFEAQDLGVGAFVRKPFTKSTISAAVRTELERNVKLATNTLS